MKGNIEQDIIQRALAELDPECFKLLYEFWIVDRSADEIATDLDLLREELEKRHIVCRRKFLELIEKYEATL